MDGSRFLKVYVNDNDLQLQELVKEKGYNIDTEGIRPIYRFDIPEKFPEIRLPKGFHLTSLAEDCDWAKVHRVVWRGFNHPGEPDMSRVELESRQRMFDTVTARRDLKIAVTDEK